MEQLCQCCNKPMQRVPWYTAHGALVSVDLECGPCRLKDYRCCERKGVVPIMSLPLRNMLTRMRRVEGGE